VSNTQVTLVQLDNYGPWTVTPEPSAEMDLQNLQASLYADLTQLVGTRDGYAFYGRYDNMVAVTNGLDAEDHRRIQSSLNDRYPVTVSMAVAVDEFPARALATASERLQSAGSAQDADRRSVLEGKYLRESAPDDLRVAHFDVVDSTGRYTDEVDAFDAHVEIGSAVVELQRYLREAHDAVAYFVGGDNVIAVCPDMHRGDFETAIEAVADRAGVELQVGIGTGPTPGEAGMDAKHALEECRYEGTRIKGASAPTASD
jgi:GTP cyclohydrolase IIa